MISPLYWSMMENIERFPLHQKIIPIFTLFKNFVRVIFKECEISIRKQKLSFAVVIKKREEKIQYNGWTFNSAQCCQFNVIVKSFTDLSPELFSVVIIVGKKDSDDDNSRQIATTTSLFETYFAFCFEFLL